MDKPVFGIKLVIGLFWFILVGEKGFSQSNSNQPGLNEMEVESSLGSVGGPEVDFGEEGDVILRMYLRDILLSDGVYAIMKKGRLYLPLAEVSTLIDFPIIVDSIAGVASGWFLKPENVFSLRVSDGLVQIAGEEFPVDQNSILSDELDLFVDSRELERWLPLKFSVSLSDQILVIRSPELLPKEEARERANRSVNSEVYFAATRAFDIPEYRVVDWPEVSLSMGSVHQHRDQTATYDYSLRAAGDIALMSARFGVSGSQSEVNSATLTLGRSNPFGMMGRLNLADYEIGDTSQFLPSLIGGSLSGRGLRFGNTRLADKRDLDAIDLQGELLSDYEVELYVNDRLLGVERDSSSFEYSFQDVPLQFGQNEIRLEFYGPQGQRYTETQRSFVGSGNGQKGRFTYEFALLEPDKRVFDLIEEEQVPEESAGLRFSSALNMSYGLSRKTTLGVTVASIAAEDTASPVNDNRNYINMRVTTDFAGALVSGDLSVDSVGKVAAAISARTTLADYELSFSQRVVQRDYRTTRELDEDSPDSLTKLYGSFGVTRPYFSVKWGRLSYGFNSSYEITHSNDAFASIGTRMDVQNRYLGMSWSHGIRRQFSDDKDSSSGRIGARVRPLEQSRWSLSSDINYSDDGGQLFKSGALRLSRPLGFQGAVSITARKDLVDLQNTYSASWNRQFRRFRANSTLSGSDVEDLTLRIGVELAARRYPGSWFPSVSSSGGRASVAVQVFADDNNNGHRDTGEEVIEGVRLTRNGLPTSSRTNKNGIALLTGLSTNASVDLGIIEADIQDAGLYFEELETGVLPRPGRIPVVAVPLKRATDIEGTVTVAGTTTPAPNVRMVLTPVGGADSMEVYTEFDGYYYLSHIPYGIYNFGPDPEQLLAAGLVSVPESKKLVLGKTNEFPDPENFVLRRVAEIAASTEYGGETALSNLPEVHY